MKVLKTTAPLFLLLACAASKDEKKPFNEGLGYKYADNNKSILWEITGKGLTQPSFLYGTIHLQDKRVFAYDTVVKSVFDTSAAYAMEISMDDVNPFKMAKLMVMEEPLDEVLSPAKYATMDSLLKIRTGTGMHSRKNMKPFFIAGELIKAYEHQDMALPLDMDFFMKAKKKKKKTMGIEKLQEQLDAVDKMTVEEQADMMIEGLKEWDKMKDMYNKMVDVYLSQDIEALYTLTKDTSLAKSFETALLTNRNKVMAQRIDSIVQLQPTFNAIGAGHLYGQEGVIQLLEKRGYTLKPVKFNFGKPKEKK